MAFLIPNLNIANGQDNDATPVHANFDYLQTYFDGAATGEIFAASQILDEVTHGYINDTSAQHTAESITVADADGKYSATTVEAALHDIGDVLGLVNGVPVTQVGIFRKNVSVAAASTFPVTQAHGITPASIPMGAIGVLRGVAGGTTYGRWVSISGFSHEVTNPGVDQATYFTFASLSFDDTNVYVGVKVISNYYASGVGSGVQTLDFNAANKGSFFLPNSSGTPVATWDQIELKLALL